MKPTETLTNLEDLARQLGMTVRYEPLNWGELDISPGRCRIRGEDYLFVDPRMNTAARIELICREISRLDLSNIFIKPILRDLIEAYQEEGENNQ
ncbi:MAG: hypothetical protein HQK55_08490 [Deltaproteobacteria bacterium]|nr:hypothetical protein [Deltaproteobacteria bacterium]